ncbi:MAG: lytic transglycosylase domain-containing protein [Synechococcaceae cyanobacterium]|nr:lytic transglycosylase domain-containing protein [Synechococcaceae cyanobacterium]
MTVLPSQPRGRRPALLLAALLITPLTACRAAEPPSQRQPQTGAGGAVVAARPLPQLPTDPALPRLADGRHYPLLPADPAALAALLVAVEQALRDPATPAAAQPALGHQQQVIYRVLARESGRAEQVAALLQPPWRRVLKLHLSARRAFLAMARRRRPATSLPAWRIIPPRPPEQLLAWYRDAAKATGIAWQVLAAVNLVESGMGRIDGVSVAGARGPMQVLPTTWAEAGIGRGADIRDPRAAIHAAARYLVRRGGLRDIRRGLWGYNNSDDYGRAVLAYAELLRADPAAYTGLYHWEIHVATARGDVWLPLGYSQTQPIAVDAWLSGMPAAAPPLPAAVPTAAVPAAAGPAALSPAASASGRDRPAAGGTPSGPID